MYINHVAIPVGDVDIASNFYVDLFGATVVPSPRFPVPAAWVLLGKVGIHMVANGGTRSSAYHFAVSVRDRAEFEALYRRAEQERLFELQTFPHHIFEMPGGEVQMWITDPAGNIIEIDYPVASDLAPDIVASMKRWSDAAEQSDWHRKASLFMPEQEGLELESRIDKESHP